MSAITGPKLLSTTVHFCSWLNQMPKLWLRSVSLDWRSAVLLVWLERSRRTTVKRRHQQTHNMDTTHHVSGSETPAGLSQWERGLICYLFDLPAFKKHSINPRISVRKWQKIEWRCWPGLLECLGTSHSFCCHSSVCLCVCVSLCIECSQTCPAGWGAVPYWAPSAPR